MGRLSTVLLLSLASALACTRPSTPPAGAARSFDEELALVVRAGRGELPDEERRGLLQENHPLLAQLGDPNTRKLVELFAQLPHDVHARLVEESYLKWSVADLDEPRRQVVRELVQVNIDVATSQGGQLPPGFSLEALERGQTGFAVVDVAGTGQKVVSWFVLWPELPSPTWVTVVNARAAGTPPYFQAHQQRLPLLRSMSDSALPLSGS